MKKIYTILMILTINLSFSQDPRIFENFWYLTNIIENGNSYIPPTSNMGINFATQNNYAVGCLPILFEVTFENNNTNFSATNFLPCLCFCTNPIAENYESNKYFPFLINNFNPINVEYFTYIITELLGEKTLIINNAYNKQALYSSVMLSNKNFEKSDFNIYPNPSAEFIEININANSINNATVEFYNEIGLSCKTVKLSFEKTIIETKDLANGMYFVKITTENGTTTTKLIKK